MKWIVLKTGTAKRGLQLELKLNDLLRKLFQSNIYQIDNGNLKNIYWIWAIPWLNSATLHSDFEGEWESNEGWNPDCSELKHENKNRIHNNKKNNNKNIYNNNINTTPLPQDVVCLENLYLLFLIITIIIVCDHSQGRRIWRCEPSWRCKFRPGSEYYLLFVFFKTIKVTLLKNFDCISRSFTYQSWHWDPIRDDPYVVWTLSFCISHNWNMWDTPL